MAQHNSSTPIDARDRYETPDYLFKFEDNVHKFDIDLASSIHNRKCELFFCEDQNGLTKDWCRYGKTGWLNPPYSKIAPWVDKAIEQQKKGFTTVMLIPTPNGESYYSKIFQNAEKMVFISGRVSFVACVDFYKNGRKGKDGKPDIPPKLVKKGEESTGNSRGSCLVTFSGIQSDHGMRVFMVDRDLMKKRYENESNI